MKERKKKKSSYQPDMLLHMLLLLLLREIHDDLREIMLDVRLGRRTMKRRDRYLLTTNDLF